MNFSNTEPPVTQRPQDVDRNIYWINTAAPLAKLYLDKNQGYGHDNLAWRMYMIERYIEIIVQIKLNNKPNDELLSVSNWVIEWGKSVVDIQVAAASDLKGFIGTAKLVETNEKK